MLDWLNFGALAFAVAVAAYKLLRIRGKPGADGIRYLCAFFLCIGLGLAVMAPPVLTAVSRIEPVPNLGRLAGNALEMLAAYFLGALGWAVARPAGTRRWLRRHGLLLAGALSLMGVLLAAADTRFTLNFVNAYSHDPQVVGYLAVFFCYILVCLFAFMAGVGGYLRHAGTGVLGVGLRFVVAGTALGVLWAAWSGVRPVITLLTGRSLATTLPVGATLGTICMLLWLIGATLTAWGDGITAPLRWWRTLRALRRIDPLWRALRAALPQIALETGRDTSLRGLEFALYRRVIEIRDAQLALRPYAHPEAARWAGPGADPATLEAAVLAAALVGHVHGRRYGAEHPFQDVDASLASESAWLARVARQYAHAEEVARVRRLTLAEITAEAASGGVASGEAQQQHRPDS
ncbi:MAB_1171c family putative transporter [Micromonosporaceae bacterium DT194]|uniref:MAB_1171c family putative transporter n=1 Tax=Melissospora conviva TaxID=3388432 RepID=UPI003C199517